MSNLSNQLNDGVTHLGLSLSNSAQEKVLNYLSLLQRWSKVYNLVAKARDEEILVKHILDCLAVVPHISSDCLADIGSGAGLPGILIAIACPEKSLTLIEPREKRVAFLQEVVIHLSLPNVKIVCDRVENFQPEYLFDGVIARAFTRLDKLIQLCDPILKRSGIIYLMEGIAKPQEYELNHYQSVVIPLKVPFLEAERH